MIAVIKGDIVSSRKMEDPDRWLTPLKNLLDEWGRSPAQWELVWGDSFQLEMNHPEEALKRALLIKALIKRVAPADVNKIIDIRMSIGIGAKTYSGTRISESNGEAFVFAGEIFEELEKKKVNLLIKSPWSEFDEDMNLFLKLASIFMDNWSTASAELVEKVLRHPTYTQKKIGTELGIKQNSVSGRWKRACMDELLEVEAIYRKKLEKLRS